MAKFEDLGRIDLLLPGVQYPVIFCRNGLKDPGLLRRYITSPQVLIVTNSTIAPYYLDDVKAAFSSVQCDTVILDDGEEYKNQQSLFHVYDALIQNRHHRDTTVIALGGGVVGDLAGFAASTYQRGVRLVQIPTTLLAQVDSSVGGKTAINHPQGKNMIGSFYHPQAVIIDFNTLNTLPEREFRAGLGEVIKYGLLEGGVFLSQLVDVLKNGLTTKSQQLPQIVAHCVQIKADFVKEDEREHGKRALLNLGHTFAHALEAYTEYKQWLHGEAVGIGLYCAAVLSYNMGILDASTVTLVAQLLKYAGLAHQIPHDIDVAQLRDLMSLDKKIKDNCLRFVVFKKPGACYLDDKITEHCLHKTLVDCQQSLK